MVTLRHHAQAGALVDDISGQYLLEAEARSKGLVLTSEFTGGSLTYHLPVGVPGSNEERHLQVVFARNQNQPSVYADGPRCLRHRWSNDSLCMWDPWAAEMERWVVADGLGDLRDLAAEHLYCEAECRGGQAWPRPEMPGVHPRKRACPSCRGRGR
jgi:hypothetical protein